MLFRSIGQLARRGEDSAPGSPEGAVDTRKHAEERVRRALQGRPLRRALFFWVLRNARGRVRDRENLRLERTRLFGRVRSLFVELGKRFHERRLLDHPRDVFYLQVDEVLGYVEGTVTGTDLRALAALRRREFAACEEGPAPPDRFETRGIVYENDIFASTQPTPGRGGDERRGIGCCPGRVRGRARVVRDPHGALLEKGDILVAERTDPSWILLFPLAAGLVVERGSLLSHSAIVAREMGIPAVVSLSGATGWIRDGDEVELDGASGAVRRRAAAGEGSQ
jgi:pyruvate,water dikinase